MDITTPTEEEIQKKMRERRIARSGAKPNDTPPPTPAPTEDDTTPIRHAAYEESKAIISLRENLYMVGPAGSGKSKIAELVAEELSLPYSAPPIGRETTMAQLFGYFNASGEYVRTPIRERAEHGGVLHLEEIDFASPAVGTALNALLANDYIGFPDITVKRHPDCIIVASANTYGTGANAQYIGSLGLNAATLDRFVFQEIDYDERMERRISSNKPWCSHVQSVRRKVAALGLKFVVSPRASVKGSRLIDSKQFTWERVEKLVLFKGLDALTIAKIGQTVAQIGQR